MKMQAKEMGISPAGEAELYHIGQRLRKKVPGLLHSHFDPQEIEVRCTDTDRSKRSALSFLQGIYEHSGETKTHNKGWNHVNLYSKRYQDQQMLTNDLSL